MKRLYSIHAIEVRDPNAKYDQNSVLNTYSARDKKVIRALESVGIADLVHRLPTELSGGQKQRVAIARAIVGQPTVLLADEPTGALDEQTGSEVLDLLLELNKQGMTIIMVTHDRDIAKRCHRIVNMRDGLIESIS